LGELRLARLLIEGPPRCNRGGPKSGIYMEILAMLKQYTRPVPVKQEQPRLAERVANLESLLIRLSPEHNNPEIFYERKDFVINSLRRVRYELMRAGLKRR
jgi:hypothetical protein